MQPSSRSFAAATQKAVDEAFIKEIGAWTEFFTEDCRYEIIPKENVNAGLHAPVVCCRSRKMLRDGCCRCTMPTSSKVIPTGT